MTISYETSEQMLNLLTFALTRIYGDDIETIEDKTSELFEQYCDAFGIDEIEDPTSLDDAVRVFFDEEPVDECDYEIGYDPYAGCFTDDV
jgi:hypothetical protein